MIDIASPSLSWVDAIGWMLLDSLWQGAAVATTLAITLHILRRASAQTRYLAACLAMTLIVALPTASLRLPEAIPSGVPSTHAVDPEAPVQAFVSPEIDDSRATQALATRFVDRLRPVLPAIVALWVAGTGVFSLRLLGGWVHAQQWLRRDTRPLTGPWLDQLDRLKERMKLPQAVRLLESSCIEVPMVVGWLRPAILVPVAALSGLSAVELEAILAHELAHIRRHDYLINLLQCVVETLVFYHPATWWISHVIRREREHCCDDMAVATCRDRIVYARALAAMEGLRAPAFSLSPAANGGILLARVRRILNPQEESMKPVRILVGLALVLAVAPIWLVRADDQPAPVASSRSATTPFPNRSFADIITQLDAAPTGRLMVEGDDRLAGDDGARSRKPRSNELRARNRVRQVGAMFLESSARTQPASPTELQTERRSEGPIPVISADSVFSVDPPTEVEVEARLPRLKGSDSPFYQTRRDHVRIRMEMIGNKVDPVKNYPLAGTCQLVHEHYKCTVEYDDLSWSDYPIPFQHVDHKTHVVYIDKDYLRRAPGPGQPARSLDAQLDKISREVEELKRKRQFDRKEHERMLDRLIKELEDLKREIQSDPRPDDQSNARVFDFWVGGVY